MLNTIEREKKYSAGNSSKKKGPRGPDGIRHPPPDNRINNNMYYNDMNVNRGSENKYSLPPGWRWIALGEVCKLNPLRPSLERDDYAVTTFVPMSAVDEKDGIIARPEKRPYSEIKKGYTYFVEGDVLFAKITPCMQNGKHAIARGLIDEIGFGSTEFHVIQPSSDICSEWIHFFVRQPYVLQSAIGHFTGAVGQQRVPESYLAEIEIPLPPLSEQKRIAAILNEQMALAERARAAVQTQLDDAKALQFAYVRESLFSGEIIDRQLKDCLFEVTDGVGSSWINYPVLGVTREGLAAAKEPVGKSPGRYKLADEGTIFYNPMRILIGSIALVDQGDSIGITSPDYVVVKSKDEVLHYRWFYHWLRSPYGNRFIRSLARGAVRERMLFKRLAIGRIQLPSWTAQREAADKIMKIRPLIARISAQLNEINALPAAVLRKAFTGELQ